MTRLEKLVAYGNFGSSVAVAITLGLTAYALILQNKSEIRAYTFEVSSRYWSGDLANTQISLLTAVSEAQGISEDLKLDADDLSIYFEKLPMATDLSALDHQIVRIALFFNSVLSCVSALTCDELTAKALLADDARGFNCVFGPRLNKLSRNLNLPNLLSGVEFFRKEGCTI